MSHAELAARCARRLALAAALALAAPVAAQAAEVHVEGLGTGNETVVITPGTGGSNVTVQSNSDYNKVEVYDSYSTAYARGEGCNSTGPLVCGTSQYTVKTIRFLGQAGVDRIVIGGFVAYAGDVHGGSGNDDLAGGSLASTVAGDGGNDTVRGSGGADHLGGGPGNDVLTGGPGDDHLDGGPGNDTLEMDEATTTNGRDDIRGGAGKDSVFYDQRTANLALTDDNAAGDGQPGEGDDVHSDVESMTGGAGDDTITGGAGANTLVGGCGSDKVNGAAGDDFVYGDGASACSGSDRVKGGAGNDVVQGNHGDDRVDGGSGKDRIEGDGSVGGCIGTSCFAIGGADTIVSRDGKKDTVKCGPGADTLKADKKDKVAKDCETVKRKVAKVAEAR